MLFVELEIRNGHIDNVMFTDDVFVHIYDYNKKWAIAVLEKDKKGDLCKQTIWRKKNTAKIKVEVFIKEGVVYKIIMPVEEGEMLVKTYTVGKTEPNVKKYTKKAKK